MNFYIIKPSHWYLPDMTLPDIFFISWSTGSSYISQCLELRGICNKVNNFYQHESGSTKQTIWYQERTYFILVSSQKSQKRFFFKSPQTALQQLNDVIYGTIHLLYWYSHCTRKCCTESHGKWCCMLILNV